MKTTKEEIINARTIRRKNERMYPIYKMFSVDLVFYYAIEFLFLTQIKGLSISIIVFATAFYGLSRIITQIPSMIIVERIGKRNGIIIGNIFNFVYILLIIFCNCSAILLIAQIVESIGFGFKGICEPSILNESIPNFRKKSDIFSKLDGMGLSWYYYFSAASAIISGFLFSVNGYIPMILCMVFIIVSICLSFRFKEPKGTGEFVDPSVTATKSFNKYLKEYKSAFKFIFTSRRLKSLILFSGAFYGFMSLMGRYEVSILDNIGISSTALGIIMATLSIISGIASNNTDKFHNSYKNKSLSFIGFTYTAAAIVAAIALIFNLSNDIALVVILIMYAIRYIDNGIFNVLINKYLGNFSDSRISMKVYAANNMIQNLGRTVICTIGSVVVGVMSTQNAIFFIGMSFLIVIGIILVYMKPRVGLKAEEYDKKDIEYKK